MDAGVTSLIKYKCFCNSGCHLEISKENPCLGPKVYWFGYYNLRLSHLRLSQDTNHIIGITAYEYVLVAEPIQIYFKAGSNHPYVSSCNVVLQ